MSIHSNDGRQIKKKAIKEHSSSAIKGMRKFVSEEAKEKVDMDKKSKSVKKKSTGGIKKTGKFEGKSNRLGGGGRFKQVEAKARAAGAKNPAAIAAIAGRKSLGKAKFQRLATAGKKRNAKA